MSKCIDDYCSHELAAFRIRNPELARRTILFTMDNLNAEPITDEDIMARHGAIYTKSLDYTREQSEMIDYVWGTVNAIEKAMLVDGNLPEDYWEDANRYAAFIYNHLPPHGKGADGRFAEVHRIYSIIWAHIYFFITYVRLVSGANSCYSTGV